MAWYNIGMPQKLDLTQYKGEIISRYAAGESHIKIAEDMPFSAGTVINRLREWGIQMRAVGESNKVDVEPYKKQVISAYESGKSVHAIAKEVPFAHDTIHSRLIEWGISLRRPAHAPKYGVRHDAFSGINEYSAYFAGYIAADGHVAKGRGDFGETNWRVAISSKDKDILEKFRNFVCTDTSKPLYDNNDGSTHTFLITSQEIGEQLISWGITPAKSLTLKIKNKALLRNRHFWRGYIDGDGCISGNNRITISLLSGSRPMIEDFLEFVFLRTGLHKNKVRVAQGKYFSCSYSGKFANIIIDLLYDDAEIYLDRKYNLIKAGDA